MKYLGSLGSLFVGSNLFYFLFGEIVIEICFCFVSYYWTVLTKMTKAHSGRFGKRRFCGNRHTTSRQKSDEGLQEYANMCGPSSSGAVNSNITSTPASSPVPSASARKSRYTRACGNSGNWRRTKGLSTDRFVNCKRLGNVNDSLWNCLKTFLNIKAVLLPWSFIAKHVYGKRNSTLLPRSVTFLK